MGQIININVGKAGLRIGEQFLNIISSEHFSDQDQKRGKSHIFFNETQKFRESRSIFLDMHSKNVDCLKLNKQSYIIKEQNTFKSSGLYSDLFAIGKYFEGSDLAQQAMQKIRKQCEKCDCLSGFLMVNSLGDGSGSGMNATLLQQIRDSYPDRMVQSHLLFPDLQNLTSPTQIHNSVLAFHYLIQHSDICILTENQACIKRLKSEYNLRPTLKEINYVLAQEICQSTAPYRFSGLLNSNQRKVCVNLVMFPRMKFLVSAFSHKNDKFGHLESTFEQKNMLKTNFFQNSTGFRDIFTMNIHCRDNFMYEQQVNSKLRFWLKTKNLKLCQWLPHNIHVNMSSPIGSPKSSMLINSKHVSFCWQKLVNIFTKIFRAKAFIHYYLNFGMDEMEFIEAESNLNDLISEYTAYVPTDSEDEEYSEFPE